MLTKEARADVAHLQILAAAAQAYEKWHNAQVEVIHKRMHRRRFNDEKVTEVSAIAMAMPPISMFETFHDIDAELRKIQPPAHEDRKYLAEVRCWLRDSLLDLCNLELDSAVEHLERSAKRLDWLLHGRSRAGSRKYRLLDDESVDRLVRLMDQVDSLLNEVTRVRALVAA